MRWSLNKFFDSVQVYVTGFINRVKVTSGGKSAGPRRGVVSERLYKRMGPLSKDPRDRNADWQRIANKYK